MKHQDCGGELVKQRSTRLRPEGRYKCATCATVIKLGGRSPYAGPGYIRAQGFVTATGRK